MMKLSDLSSHISDWFSGTGPAGDIVISSRIRLARNLRNFDFLSRCATHKKKKILEQLREALQTVTLGEQTFFVRIDEIPQLHSDLLVERQLISRQHALGIGPRGAVIAESEFFTAMINEEDHLRIQVLKAGQQLSECWKLIDRIDDELQQKIQYAFDRQYGYLTACPTNVGTGIRVSVMLHLPALKMTKHIEKFFNMTRDMNLALRGLFGEGTETVGDFYQLSNQATLGVSETEIIALFTDTIIPKISEYENLARQALLTRGANLLADKMHRALAILSNARMISSHEALSLLSQVRMGVHMKQVKTVSISTINELFMLTQPAHLQINSGRKLDPAQRDFCRAEIIRTRLSQN
ncbi:MAG: protein arginine kinase [Planctomycetota bacterium]